MANYNAMGEGAERIEESEHLEPFRDHPSWKCSAHLDLARNAKRVADQALERSNEAIRSVTEIRNDFAHVVESQKAQFARMEESQRSQSDMLLRKFDEVDVNVKALMKESNNRQVAHDTVIRGFNLVKAAVPVIAILIAALVYYLKKEAPSAQSTQPQVIYVMPSSIVKGP